MTNSATTYHFLSLCLLYPEANLVLQLREAAAISDQAWPDALVEAFAGESLDTLQMEHTRLFVNNIEGVPCPPYESVYVDGRLLSATTAAVVAAYAEWGLEQSSETADFLPLELQCVRRCVGECRLRFGASWRVPSRKGKRYWPDLGRRRCPGQRRNEQFQITHNLLPVNGRTIIHCSLFYCAQSSV
jgi:hypothetical protein